MIETEVLEPTTGTDEVQPTAEVPAAPEGVAPSAAGDEPAITESAAPLSTRTRGPDGRFIKADGTEASVAEHAVMEAAEPASPPTPPPVASPPFVFRADGQKIPIPGSTVAADGSLTIPADQLPTIRQLLSEGVTHRGSWRREREDFQRQVQEAGAVESARAEKYNDVGIYLWDWIDQHVEDGQEKEFLRREVDLRLRSADLKAPRPAQRAAAPQDTGQEAQLETAARQTLAEYVEELLDTPQAQALYPTPQDRRDVFARYARRVGAYFVERDGELALHENAVDADFQDEIKLRQAGRQAARSATKAEEFNAKRNVPPANAPPVVSTRGPGSTGTDGARVFKDKEEYRKAMGLS